MGARTVSSMARTNATSIRTSHEVVELVREIRSDILRSTGRDLVQADALEAALKVAKRHMSEVVEEFEDAQ